MSYGVSPYAVSIAAVQACLGSQNAQLLQTLTEEFQSAFRNIDRIDEEAVPVQQALSQLIMGEPPDEDYGYKYGYALEFLCDHFGEMQSNQQWSSMRWDWVETVDQALADFGVPAQTFRVSRHLLCRDAPVPLPRIEDFPSIGYLRESEIARAQTTLDQLPLDQLENQEIADSLREVRRWLAHCQLSHQDLICFYY